MSFRNETADPDKLALIELLKDHSDAKMNNFVWMKSSNWPV